MPDQVLPSWRPGSARSSILEFLDRSGEIPPADRVAVFDNDGTMWAEKPHYPQVEFFVAELRRAVSDEPALGDRPEYRALLDGDRQALADMGLETVAIALLDLFTGITPSEFDIAVRAFFAGAEHPERRVPYRQMLYRPMLELTDELRSRSFDVYLVTAGGAEFVRAISDDFYGVKPEGVVGSQIEYEFVRDGDGRVRLLRTNRLVGTGPNEGAAKPPNIQRILGRRPVVAGGNSPGDADMLEYAMSYDGPSLALLVDHDDAEREYAYAGVAGTFVAEESITDTAARLGWTVVSMRSDWATIF